MSVTTDSLAVDSLFTGRKSGSTGLDISGLGLDKEQALDMQLAVLDRFVDDGDGLAGWKVSYTSGNARDRMGPRFRPFGYVLKSRMLGSGDRIAFTAFANAAIEPELCLELKSPLSGEVDPEQAREAVAFVLPAFELNESRSKGDEASILADGCGNWGIVIGRGTAPKDALADTTVELWRNDDLVSTTTPSDSMDDPYLSLARLSAKLAEHGRSLEAGQRVITGSFARKVVEGPTHWKAVFQGIGEVTIDFT